MKTFPFIILDFCLIERGMYLNRTKAEPPIYYLPNKPLDEDATVVEKHKEEV